MTTVQLNIRMSKEIRDRVIQSASDSGLPVVRYVGNALALQELVTAARLAGSEIIIRCADGTEAIVEQETK